MKAAILAIGDELTSGLTTDTNSPWLAMRLREHGVTAGEIRVVSDDRPIIARAISDLARERELLCITGGLGPTPDDLTRDALGDVVTPGIPLEIDAEALTAIERWFGRSGRVMPAMNARQAERPRGAAMLPNDRGTAPGIELVWHGCRVIAMPGVPAEMKPMFERSVQRSVQGEALLLQSVHTFGMGESDLATLLGDLLARGRSPQLGTGAGGGIVSVRAYGEEAQQTEIERTLKEVERRAWPYAFGRDDATLASSLATILLERGQSLATAESCTGGLLGAMLTEVPGSSRWYAGGWITYSNALKERELAISTELLEHAGAVSSEVANAMGEGALRTSSADLSLSITGIAGPDGGTDRKPVGTVFIACSRRQGDRIETRTRQFLFIGERDEIRHRSAQTAVQIARFTLLGVDPAIPLLREVVNRPGVPQ